MSRFNTNPKRQRGNFDTNPKRQRGSLPRLRIGLVLMVFAILCVASPLFADDELGEYIKVKTDGEYKVVTIPIKALDEGKTVDVMVRGVLTNGVVAIGGETTGTVIKVGKTVWELDLSGDPKFAATIKEQSGKVVIVTGKVKKKDGVEVKTRTILKVEGLTAAGK